MRIKLNRININTKDYHEKFYEPDPISGISWLAGYDDGIKRLKQIIEIIPKIKTHLDIGCADGTFTKLLLEKYPDSKGYGIDLAERACELAKQNCPNGIFIQSDCYQLPDRKFDLVHCGQLLEHLEKPQELIDKVYKVLNKDGLFILTTINEKAEDYKEHLWKWDLAGVKDFLKDFEVIKEDDRFFNGHLLFLIAKKCE